MLQRGMRGLKLCKIRGVCIPTVFSGTGGPGDPGDGGDRGDRETGSQFEIRSKLKVQW